MRMLNSKEKPVELSPAYRWAQSLNTTFLEVKFATRFDSPACLDVTELKVTLGDDGRALNVSAICGRSDDKKLFYNLVTELAGQVK